MDIFANNENQLAKLRAYLKSPSLNPALRIETNRKIQSLLDEVKKSKDIKEKLDKVLYVKNGFLGFLKAI